MKRIVTFVLMLTMIVSGTAVLSGCGETEKNITVVVRERGSGTREAFDKVVTDGEHFLEEKDADGKKVYNTTTDAVEYTKTGNVLTAVASDKNAIGYISYGSVNDTINVIKVNGVAPSEATVLDGTYKIQRPFVVMTKKGLELTPITADFMNYIKSGNTEQHAKDAGCIFLSDPAKRANEGDTPIEVVNFEKSETLPDGGKIVVRGSTSMEQFINNVAKGYADLYGVSAEDIFDIQLEGSSVGRSAVEDDTTGNVVGLSSAAVDQDDIDSFNACLDAVAVIVNRENTAITDLTLNELYDIFSGKIKKFSELNK